MHATVNGRGRKGCRQRRFWLTTESAVALLSVLTGKRDGDGGRGGGAVQLVFRQYIVNNLNVQ